GQRYAYGLLAASAVVRMAGQLLRVNVLGALTLSLDVYALALLAGLHLRRRPLSPGWLALLFALSLPLERALQRLLGYGLQRVSTDGACGLLDLPCPDIHGLMLVLTMYVALAALCRPSVASAVSGFAIALLSALGADLLHRAVLA